ncbi:tyrosine-type recombinase/integrase [Bradyrhizobium commune]|uniref:Tyrosine-type recombinase/integrase n=1 Tax=Bradyrhizobium commune TaxID=83627 RepID=A0A7S9GXF9_9BRAD|nr:tyrosine-type recombinase/integrase [Bradyrhizobium commune]QPF88615.1 tyrosine-type recombinase/integrase [Bradyrhizobium commune]
MPRKWPPHVDRNHVKGRTYLSFRIGKGPRVKLPDDPTSQEFRDAYAAAMAGGAGPKPAVKKDAAGTIGALIAAYKSSGQYGGLSETSKSGYASRLEQIRVDHGHRAVAGLNKDRITSFILDPLTDRPGAALDTLKKLRILIQFAISKEWLKHDPSQGIKRPKGNEVRSWTDAELAAFERRWPIGTKQRTAYALMLNMGTARVDTHVLTWPQVDDGACYRRHKTGVQVDMAISEDLQRALTATPRKHVCVLITEWGKPFTVDGFSGWMRDAITAAGISDLTCRPHGLRKTLGRLLADAGCSAHDIMAALGHTTLAEAERYTREADRRRGGKRAVASLDAHRANKSPQTTANSLGKIVKTEGKTRP